MPCKRRKSISRYRDIWIWEHNDRDQGVQYSYLEAAHKRHVMAFTYPPQCCAIPDSFSFQQPANYFLECLTDSEMDALRYEDLLAAMDRSHPLERLFRKLNEAVLAGLIQRHLERHSLTMEERFLAFCRRSPHLLQWVPHKHLASYLDIDPTNFSKLFRSVRI